MTNTPPTIGNNNWVFVVSANAANPAPIAWLPTSPMKMRAGAAFHHRNPAAAAAMAAATTARSSAGPTWYSPMWRNSQNPTKTKAANAKTDEPAARPSSPSVRFTALAAPTTIRTAHTMYTMFGSDTSVGRANDRWVLTFAQYTAKTAKAMATTNWRTNLARGFSPKLRCRVTLIQSSISPTAPIPTIANSTRAAADVKTAPLRRCATP